MKRWLVALLSACAIAHAGTTVTGTIVDPSNDPLSGSCTIQPVEAFTSGSARVVGAPMTVQFSAGAFSATLAPTDTATPAGQYYVATCAIPRQTTNGHSVGPFSWGPIYWLIPTSATSIDIATAQAGAEGNPPAPPSIAVPLSQLGQSGATPGQVPSWNGSAWVPSNGAAAAGTVVIGATPADGQLVQWSASAGKWLPVTIVTGETPAGTIDGTNTTFTLAAAPTGLQLLDNGLGLSAGVDYNLSGNTITFVPAATPQPGDILAASYRHY